MKYRSKCNSECKKDITVGCVIFTLSYDIFIRKVCKLAYFSSYITKFNYSIKVYIFIHYPFKVEKLFHYQICLIIFIDRIYFSRLQVESFRVIRKKSKNEDTGALDYCIFYFLHICNNPFFKFLSIVKKMFASMHLLPWSNSSSLSNAHCRLE